MPITEVNKRKTNANEGADKNTLYNSIIRVELTQ